jgi:sulfide dehydrogenase [flavocytochrome c] flavoprotein chain
MNMNRRDALKVGAVSVAAAVASTTLTGCVAGETGTAAAAAGNTGKVLGKHKVVIIGGGMGGLSVANNLKKIDSSFDIAIIEKNDTFMACPVSNTYLGKLEGMNLGTFVFDYAQPIEKYGYAMLKSEVIAIDRTAKTVTTAAGIVGYDILVLSPGIAYNYEGQFPTWSKAKVAEVQRACPPAMISGAEHVTLERQLMNMDSGDVVIASPIGKFRCPPAPFERAAMIAEYMKKEEIAGKVIVLVQGGFAKKAAFMESAKDIYGDRIVYLEKTKVTDIDVAGKTIHFEQKVGTGKKDSDGEEIMQTVKKSHKYSVCNFMVNHKASPVVQMATLDTTADAYKSVKMNGCSFQTATDKDVYVVGDIVGHAIPPSGQTAVWAGKECALEIAHRLHGKPYTLGVKTKEVKAANVCFSMVGDGPEEGIMVTHDFSWTGAVIKGKGHVPKAPSGKFRSANTAKALRDWYRGIMADLFA